MNVLDVQTVFERATPQVDKSNLKSAFILGAVILIGAIVLIDYFSIEVKSMKEPD